MNTTQFKPGDHVRKKIGEGLYEYYCYGEITLIGAGFSFGYVKVIWGNPLYDYNYEKLEDLELIEVKISPNDI